MSRDIIPGAIDAVRSGKPLVHCITNYVTVNDCANALLAVGGAPVMADDEAEAADIAGIANALVINIGTLNARTIRSMKIAGKAAAAKKIPVVLDPVGAGASRLRTDTALELIAEIPFTVIRGNVSEIRTLVSGTGSTRGVDASASDLSEYGISSVLADARALSEKTGAVVAVTGATDVIAFKETAYAVDNGHIMLTEITGSGCMLSAITGAFAGAMPENPAEAVAAAFCTMGLSGEIAAKASKKLGIGSFHTALIDALYRMDRRTLEKGMKLHAL